MGISPISIARVRLRLRVAALSTLAQLDVFWISFSDAIIPEALEKICEARFFHFRLVLQRVGTRGQRGQAVFDSVISRGALSLLSWPEALTKPG